LGRTPPFEKILYDSWRGLMLAAFTRPHRLRIAPPAAYLDRENVQKVTRRTWLLKRVIREASNPEGQSLIAVSEF